MLAQYALPRGGQFIIRPPIKNAHTTPKHGGATFPIPKDPNTNHPRLPPQHPLDLHPQLLCLVDLISLESILRQHVEKGADSRGVIDAAKHLPVMADAVLVPLLNDVQRVVGDEAPVAAVEGRFVVVDHALQDGDDALEGRTDLNEEVHHPGWWPDAALLLLDRKSVV